MEYIEIIHKIALLFSLSVFFVFILKQWQRQAYFKNVFFGIIFGFITVIGMITPFVFSEGLILDARSVILGLSGLFGGPISALISSTIAAIYRLHLGGVGAFTGLITIYISSFVGVVGYYLYKRQAKLTNFKLLLIGFLIHCGVVLAMFTLPDGIQIIIMATMAFPYLIIFPLIFWLLGKLLLITEAEVENQRLLKESRERLHYALEGSENGVWDWNIPNNKFFYTKQWKSMLGYTDDEIENTYDAWYQLVHPDDLQKTLHDIEAHISGKTKFYKNEYRLRHKNGSWVSMLARGKVVSFDESGSPLRMVGTHTDITELKEQSARTKQLKELYDSIIDSIDNLVFVKDNTFTYIACNTAFTKFLDKPKDKIIGYTDYDLFDKSIADFFRGQDKQMLESKSVQSNFEWVTYPNGQEAYLLTVKSPLIDNNNNIIGLVGNSVEVTEQKRLQDQLEEAQSLAHFGSWTYDIKADKMTATQEVYNIFGLDKDEILTKDTFSKLYHPNDAERAEDTFLNSLKTSQGVGHIITRIFKADTGESRIVEEKWQVQFDNGVAIKTIGTTQDITEKKKEEDLRKDSFLETIKAVALTIEKRDPYTSGHQQRVAELAVAIAKEMDLSDDRIEGIKLGGIIHDIGKIQIPAEILNRPGRLSEHELGLIQTHPRVGYEIIENIKSPWPIKEMVIQHHEKLNGAGYPNGLKGDEIILEARIIAVADVVEAINSHRPYRPALGIKIAIEELKKGKGTLFDSKVVDACLKVLKTDKMDWVVH